MVASQNVKLATPNEALAHAVLHGQPIIPEEVMSGNEQQSFLDARTADNAASEGYSPSVGENLESQVIDDDNELPFIDWVDDNTNLAPIPKMKNLNMIGLSDLISLKIKVKIQMVLMQPKNLQKQRLPARIDADQVLSLHSKGM